MNKPRTETGRRIDAAFAAAAARGDTSASWSNAREWVVAIEDEARRDFLDELIQAGAVVTPMSYDELREVADRLHARLQLVHDQRGGAE